MNFLFYAVGCLTGGMTMLAAAMIYGLTCFPDDQGEDDYLYAGGVR